MKQWLIPAIMLLAVGGMGLGVGWSINDWQDGGDSTPVPTEQPVAPVQTGPTQAELDAERQREEDGLCLEAKQTAAAQKAAHDARQAAIERGEIRPIGLSDFNVLSSGVDKSVLDAIERYCD